MITITQFGELSDGRPVLRYELENISGMRIAVINYGATVTNIFVPDKKGHYSDVVLGYDSVREYEDDGYFIGAIIGRYGNRIAGGRFRLGDRQYQLNCNDGPNHLHGGSKGFYKALWDSEANELKDGLSVKLAYKSPDSEEGYPGNLTTHVIFTLRKGNALEIQYTAKSDQPTILNPTHHSYFNLSGNHGKTILDHELEILADAYTPVNEFQVPTGEISDVTGTPMDFRQPVAIGQRIDYDFEQLARGQGYDHNWVLNNYDATVRKVASVYHPLTGRTMEVLTDQPGIQFYSGNFLNSSITGKNGTVLKKRSGLCLETQHFPDSPNQSHFPPVTLLPGETYHQKTIYKFSVK